MKGYKLINSHIMLSLALSNTIAEHDRELKRKLLPLLHSRINQAKKSISDCETVKEMATDW